MPRVAWSEHVVVESSREGLPPLLVAQAGPGLPVLHERRRYRRLLALEDRFSVHYWDRSGTGLHPPPRGGLSLEIHLGEMVEVLRRICEEAQRKVVVLGISMGATLALLARERLPGAIDRVIAISADLDIPTADRYAHDRIQAAVREPRWRSLVRSAARLRPGPCADPAQLQLRAELLGRLGSLEARSSWGTQLRRTMFAIARAYGPHRLPRVLSNMNDSARELLPEQSRLDVFARWPVSSVPVHMLFGTADLLSPPAIIERARARLGPHDSLRVIPEAAHMIHFDAPAVVRSAVVGAEKTAC